MFLSSVKLVYILYGLPYSPFASIPTAAFLHRKCFPECPNKRPKPKRVPEDKPMPEAGAVRPDPQHTSEATNKRAAGSYPNKKESIMRVWRAASFQTFFSFLWGDK